MSITEDEWIKFGVHNRGCVWQKQVSRAGTSNYTQQILWGVITCPCPCYLHLTHKSITDPSSTDRVCTRDPVLVVTVHVYDIAPVLIGAGPSAGTVCRADHVVKTHRPLDKMAAILADDIFNCIFLNENDRIPIQISLKCVPRSPIDNESALVQVMVWRRTGDKPLPEQMITHFIDAYMRH